MTWIERCELYCLAIFGGIIGQWSIGLARHLWFAFVRHGIIGRLR